MGSDLEIIASFFRDSLGYEGALDPNADLLEEGILDSFNVVDLAMFIEQKFGIELHDEDISRENLAKLNDMVALIERRRQ